MRFVSKHRVRRYPRWATLMLVLLAALSLASPGTAFAQRGTSEPVGIREPRVDDSVTLGFGTEVAWNSDEWTPDDAASDEHAALLRYGGSTYSIAEQREGSALDEAWERRKATTIEVGGQPIDTAERLDGGWYGLWISPETGNHVVQAVGYAPGTDVVLSIMLISPEDEIESILAQGQVVINDAGVAWPTVDIERLMTTFAQEESTGEPVFLAAPVDESAAADAPKASAENVLVDDGTWVSPQFGYTVTWGGDWETSEDMVVSDEEQGYDAVTLSTASPGVGGLSIYGMAWDDARTVGDFVDSWASDEYLDEYQPAGTEVVLADSGRRCGAVVLVGPYSDDDPKLWVTVMEITVVGRDLEVDTTLAAPLDDIEAVYDDAQDAVSLDGDAVVGYFTTDEILDALP